jgi:hypothetical protein
MKARLLVVPFLLLAAFLASAQESGASLDTSASYSMETVASADVSATSTIYLLPQLGNASFKLRLGLSASYDLGLDGSGAALDLPTSLDALDLQELLFVVSKPLPEEGLRSFGLALGRFAYADPTGLIYNYRLDGLTLELGYKAIALDMVLGYTGLMWKGLSTVSMNVADLSATGLLGSPRALFAINLRTPPLFGQSLFLSVLAQEDLRDPGAFASEYTTEYDLEKGGPFDSQYASAGLSGMLGPLVYSLFGSFESGRVLSYITDAASSTDYRYTFEPVRAFAGGLSLSAFLGSSLTCGLKFTYGSGDADASDYVEGNTEGDSTLFVPVTKSAANLIFCPQAGNMIQAELNLGWKPFPRIRFGLLSLAVASKTSAFIKAGDGPVSEAGILAAASNPLIGFEEDLILSWALLSDLNLTLMAGAFMPMLDPVGAFDSTYEGARLQYLARLGLSLSM